jgi:hypothetical protein
MMNITNTSKSSKLKFLLAVAAGSLFLNTAAFADQEFYGRVDSRPDGNVGIWVISGQQVEVTDKTEIENDGGPLTVGSCVEVEHKKGVVDDIESVKPAKCK